MINVDARACGIGKTRGNKNSIFSEVKVAYELGQRSVIVLPSIKIFKMYEEHFETFAGGPEVVTIHSDDGHNEQQTTDRLFQALCDTEARIIVITHNTFMRYMWHNGVKKDIHLFIDEAFDPFRKVEYWDQVNSKVHVHWAEVAEVKNLGSEWNNLIIDGEALTAMSFVRDNQQIKELSDSNWNNYCHYSDVMSLFNPQPANRSVTVVQELKSEIMRDWRSVRIAAAAFEVTFMREWLVSNNIRYQIIPGCEFKKHAPLLTIHVPIDNVSNKEVKYSINKAKQKDNWVVTAFRAYVDSLKIDEPVLVLRNKSNATGGLYADETKVAFNAHGQNDFTEYTKVSLEAATNLCPVMLRFHREFHSQDFDTYRARTGYDFYQIVMRCCLRKQPPEPADVYCLDGRLATALDDFFDLGKRAELVEFWEAPNPGKKPLTPAEKQRRYRQKRKQQKI